LVFLGEAAGAFTLAGPGLTRLVATAERAEGLGALDAFFGGAAGRLLARALLTEARDAFEDFAMVRRRRTR
jgi:hypothetical protein